MPLLQLNNVYYKPKADTLLFEKRSDFELSDISLCIEKNEVTAIVGESGGGKTLLAKIMAGLIKPHSGSIELNLKRKSNISPIQILFQNNNELINPYRNVKDVLLYPANKIEMVKHYLNLLQLPETILTRKSGNLSGGERQRVGLARLLLAEPEILILDEPFSAQDIASQLNIKKILLDIKNELSLALVIISHTIKILENLADNLLVIKKGRILESGRFMDILASPAHEYTSFLLKAAEYDLSMQELKYNN